MTKAYSYCKHFYWFILMNTFKDISHFIIRKVIGKFCLCPYKINYKAYIINTVLKCVL